MPPRLTNAPRLTYVICLAVSAFYVFVLNKLWSGLGRLRDRALN